MARAMGLVVAVALALSSCSSDLGARGADATTPSSGGTTSTTGRPAPTTTATAPPTSTTTLPTTTTTRAPTTTVPPTTTTTTTTTIPTFTLRGRVVTADGAPLPNALVRTGRKSAVTGPKGRFRIEGVSAGEVRITRPAWRGKKVAWDGEPLGPVELKPRVVRALRAIPEVAGDPDRFAALLDLAEATSVNAIVFDTKDETGMVRYETRVKKAARLGAIDATYDSNDAIETAKARGFYTITRVVTFEDATWARVDPGAKLAGHWVNPADEDNWAYPLALAVEACRAGFDEIQFDYVRFPAGTTAQAAEERQPLTQEQRVATIRGFLATARERLHEHGCAISADIFGIVVSSPTDEGIGQRLEDLSPVLDAISPMIYPSHYSPGWLGFDDPNDHPGAVTADALDDAARRLHPTTILRPWLQGFYWSDHQIRTAIDATENRGHGWIIWNAAGNYDRDAIPPK